MQINRDKIGEFVNMPSHFVLLRKHLYLRSVSLQKPSSVASPFRKKLSQCGTQEVMQINTSQRRLCKHYSSLTTAGNVTYIKLLIGTVVLIS